MFGSERRTLVYGILGFLPALPVILNFVEDHGWRVYHVGLAMAASLLVCVIIFRLFEPKERTEIDNILGCVPLSWFAGVGWGVAVTFMFALMLGLFGL